MLTKNIFLRGILNIKNEIYINNEKIEGVPFWHQAPGLMKNNPYKNLESKASALLTSMKDIFQNFHYLILHIFVDDSFCIFVLVLAHQYL